METTLLSKILFIVMVTLNFDLMTPKYRGFFPLHRGIMWPSLLKIQYTELKFLCRNDPIVKNSIYSNGDLDLWPNDPKINRVLPFQRGIMWPSLVKIRYTELKLLCGNLCGRPPAILYHIIRLVSRWAYKKKSTVWKTLVLSRL